MLQKVVRKSVFRKFDLVVLFVDWQFINIGSRSLSFNYKSFFKSVESKRQKMVKYVESKRQKWKYYLSFRITIYEL